jgi:uncharacterized membrane protein
MNMDKQPPTSGWSDQRLQSILGNVLRAGVLAAATIVFCGGALYLVRHGAASPNYAVFQGEPSELCSVRGIVADVISGSSRGIIQFGLLVLIATPVARVILSLIGFARQRDRLYVGVSLAVLVLLLYSLFGGRL